MGKKKGKNILLPPFEPVWPKIDKETEDKIITALTQKLEEFPNLDGKKTKQDGKNGEATTPSSCPSSDEEEEARLKARLRQQLMIGHRQVTKGLERDQLALVLVSGDAQPPILLRSLLPLAASRQCPALCVSSLCPSVTDAVGLSSLLALGFKKSQPGDADDFSEFISMASDLAPPVSVPWLALDDQGNKNNDSNNDDKMDAEENSNDNDDKDDADVKADDDDENIDAVVTAKDENKDNDIDENIDGAALEGDVLDKKSDETILTVSTTPSSDVKGTLMTQDQEEEVITKLLQILAPYEAVFKNQRSRSTAIQWKKQRKVIRSWLMNNLATMNDAARCRRLALLLVQHSDNDLHPTLTSTIKMAADGGCPVLYLTTLTPQLSSVIRDFDLRAVGFRNLQDGDTEHPETFQQFVTMATQFCPSVPTPTPPSSKTEEKPESAKTNTVDSTAQSKKKKPIKQVYDVSSLYVYKKDLGNDSVSGGSTQKETKSGLGSYISLSGKSVQLLGAKPLSEFFPLPETAFVDSKGSGISGKKIITGKSSTVKGHSEAEKGDCSSTSAETFTGVMGLDESEAPMMLQPLYSEPRKKKTKSGLKRKMDESSESGEFLSFKLSRTAVKTSVPNPNRKKSQKKNKKR